MHCYVARWRGRLAELGPAARLRLASEMVEAGVEWVGITGGEPLLLPDFWRIAGLLSGAGVEVTVNTNALLVDEGVAEKLSRVVSRVYVSIDGSRETHEAMRRCRGCHRRVLEAVRLLTRAGVDVVPVMAVSRINYRAVDEYLETVAELGLETAALIPVMPQGEARLTGIWPDAETYNTAVLRAAVRAKDLGLRLHLWCTPYAHALRLPGNVFYGNCRLSPTIDIDPAGNILLCDVIDVVLSNAAEKGLVKAAEEAAAHPLTRAIENPELSGACRECPYRGRCMGGCYARSLLVYGALNAGDPLCPLLGSKDKAPRDIDYHG